MGGEGGRTEKIGMGGQTPAATKAIVTSRVFFLESLAKLYRVLATAATATTEATAAAAAAAARR